MWCGWQFYSNMIHSKAPVTHVLQPVGDCLATKKQLQPVFEIQSKKL